MYDLKSEALRSRAIDDMIYYHRPTLSEIYNGNIDPFIKSRYGEPSAILFHPIFKEYCGSEVVGAISTTFTIGSQLMGLPKNVNGMTCVIETNTGQQFTYNLDGDGHAILVGEGDFHEAKYDDMLLEQAFNLQSYRVYDDDKRAADCARREEEQDFEYEKPVPPGADQLLGDEPAPGLAVNKVSGGGRDPLVVMNVRIYPSSMFEGQYMTRAPAIYALVISLIFLVTSATFLIYDCLVQKRQDEVLKTAVKSTKIINNLFPSNVRDRLFNDADENETDVPGLGSQDNCAEGYRCGDAGDDDNNHAAILKEGETAFSGSKTKVNDADKRRRTKSLSGLKPSHVGRAGGRLAKTSSNLVEFSDDTTRTLSTSKSIGRSVQGPPIADLFTDTTVMFADIAGFTAWSSEREPVQVFQLLEALYREFDRTAKRAGVFKVETIGDCYGEWMSILMPSKAT